MKRFFVSAMLDDETTVLAHTNNTGSMLGLLRPGAPVLLSAACTPGRKLPWTLELVWQERAGLSHSMPPCEPVAAAKRGFWAGVNTTIPNKMLEAAFHAGRLPWAIGYTSLRREQRYGESRLDACLEGPGLPRLWVECKNVTMVEDGVALFPDVVSARGLKHLHTLSSVCADGERSVMFYLVQRADGRCFAPADMVDIAYAEGFRAALSAGVQIHPHTTVITEAGIDLGTELPLAPCF